VNNWQYLNVLINNLDTKWSIKYRKQKQKQKHKIAPKKNEKVTENCDQKRKNRNADAIWARPITHWGTRRETQRRNRRRIGFALVRRELLRSNHMSRRTPNGPCNSAPAELGPTTHELNRKYSKEPSKHSDLSQKKNMASNATSA
jgi:hypothetical protein